MHSGSPVAGAGLTLEWTNHLGGDPATIEPTGLRSRWLAVEKTIDATPQYEAEPFHSQ
jgi:hypothetical protein